MKILLVGVDHPGSLALSYKRAFESLGHDILFFDQRRNLENSFPAGKLFRKISTRSHIVRRLTSIPFNKELLKFAGKLDPDLVLVFKGTNINPNTIQVVKQDTKAFIFNFNPDNPFNPSNSSTFLLDSLSQYDCLLIWGKFLLEKLKKYNDRVHYLPFGFDPELHNLDNKPETEKDIDIAFVGSWTKNRERWLSHLKDYDLHIS